MKKRTRGILEELSTLNRRENTEEFVQTTANNIIESAINLLTKIHETYPEDTAVDLERRFINSIKASNPKKFKTGIDKILESKK